jgi:outer membrane protein assembly factor BamB
MNSKTRKIEVISILIILLASIGASITVIQRVNAHTPSWQIPTYAYIVALPNPVGVGQKLNVYMWVDSVHDGAGVYNNFRFHNYELMITSPNGTTNTITFPYISDTTSNQGTSFIPTTVGAYNLTFVYPGENINDYPHANDAFVNDSYLPSSASIILTVQQNPIPQPVASYPLPTAFWTRPIYGENTYWYTISSNYLGTGAPGYAAMGSYRGAAQNPTDAVGSQTGHIMWTKPVQSGGVVGGSGYSTAGVSYFEGSAYVQRFTNPIILNGKLYYTAPLSWTSPGSILGGPIGPTYCVDLATGQVVWSSTSVPALAFGYIYDVEDENQHGVYPAILFTANFAQAFDADTGAALFNVTGVPSGTLALGPQGEFLKYVIANAGNTTNPDYRLGEWNSSKLWTGNGFSGNTTTTWMPLISGTVDGSVSNPNNVNDRYDWNVSIPWLNTMGASTIGSSPGANPVTVLGASYNDVLLCRNGSLPSGFANVAGGTGFQGPYTYFAVSLAPGTRGNILWTQTYQPPAGNITVSDASVVDFTTRRFFEEYSETRQWVGYSLDTGAKVWGPTESQTSFDYYGEPEVTVGFGNLYTSSFAGILYCYNDSTGQLSWTYGNGGEGNSTYAGLATAYGDYPTFVTAIGSDTIYLVTTEHTITDPIYKGALARAVNATTGQEIWTLSDYTGEFTVGSYAIADGYSTFFNGYDNQIYCVGRGPSQTTVSAGPEVTTLGSNIVIQGSVTDISAGTKQTQQAADFPNGVPVSSDASMKDWMGYVYQQKPLPTNFTGVPVQISVTDSNGNTRTIGTTTTASNGKYSLVWTPDIAGNYTVYASFAGTNGYWPSSDTTAFNVISAPPTTPSATTTVNSQPTQTYILGIGIAIIIVIIIVGAATILVLRKRP